MTGTWSELASSSESLYARSLVRPPGGGFFFIHEIESGKSVGFPQVFDHPAGSFQGGLSNYTFNFLSPGFGASLSTRL